MKRKNFRRIDLKCCGTCFYYHQDPGDGQEYCCYGDPHKAEIFEPDGWRSKPIWRVIGREGVYSETEFLGVCDRYLTNKYRDTWFSCEKEKDKCPTCGKELET